MEKHLKTRREFLKFLGFSSAAFSTVHCWNLSRTKDRPNILFLFTDDQQYNAVRALGNKDVITPNMDSLVYRGITLSNMYILGGLSAAVCMPSRAMLMTGRYLFHLNNSGKNIPKNHITIPELFRKSGYITFGTCKWHNGKKSFTRSFSTGGKIMFGGMSNHWKVPLYDFDPDEPPGQLYNVVEYFGETTNLTISIQKL